MALNFDDLIPQQDQPQASQGGLSFDDLVPANDATQPGMASNAARNMGDRGTDLLGNLIQLPGTLIERGEEALANTFGNGAGVMFGNTDRMRAEGYTPDLSLGGYGVDFTRNIDPKDTQLNLNQAGQLIEDQDFGYQPNYTIERALDNPSLGTIGGAIAEQGPASLVDMAALIANLPAYLGARTQEIGEARAANDGRAGQMPSLGDMATAGPTAGASVALDRLALGKLLPGGAGGKITSAGQIPGAVVRGGAVEGSTEAMQEGGIEYGGESVNTKAGWQPGQAGKRALGGAMIGAPVGGAVRGVTATVEMRQAVKQRLAEAQNVDPSQVDDAQVDEILRQAQSTSEAASLDPDALSAAIEAALGNPQPKVGDGLPPVQARRERRRTEQELGEAFETTDIYRRDDVDVTEDGIVPRDDAQPVRDPLGEQANADTYGARSLAARTAQELGVTLDETALRNAARELAADPEADPRAIVRDYAQQNRSKAFERADIKRRKGDDYAQDRQARVDEFEAQPEQEAQRVRREYAARGIDPDSTENAFARARRQDDMREVGDLREDTKRRNNQEFSRPAFDVADARRQRREQDLATGENIGRESSDYRAAANPAERAEQREVTLLDARRDRRGRLVEGESVEVLGRGQVIDGQGGATEMVQIVRGDRDPEWVEASRLSVEQTPENPRMVQQAYQETREPPKGVTTGRGDSPEGYDASQTPQPRRAVDRIADPDGLRRGRWMPGEAQNDGPQGDGPREGETFEAERSTGMTPAGEVRTEFQGEGGRIKVNTTRKDVRETTREGGQRTPRGLDADEPLVQLLRERYGDDALNDPEVAAELRRLTQTATDRPAPPAANDEVPLDGGVDFDDEAAEKLFGPSHPVDDRLNSTETQERLRGSVQDFGWDEEGGRLLRDEHGNAVGRTKWLPRSPIMDVLKGKRLTQKGYGELVERAITGEGRKLTNRQVAILQDVLDVLENENTELDDAPDYDLEEQTEDSLAADAEAEREREEAERQQREDEARRAEADREADDFVLAGSDRSADQAMARGQNDLFGAGGTQAAPKKAQGATPERKGYVEVLRSDHPDLKGQVQVTVDSADYQVEGAAEQAVRQLGIEREPITGLRWVVDEKDLDAVLDAVGLPAIGDGAEGTRWHTPNADKPAQRDTIPGGGTLYSGIPLDLIADAVKKVTGGERRAFREMAARMGHLIESAKEASGGTRASQRASKRSPLVDLWRVTLGSLDGDMRSLVKAFKSDTLKTIPDMFHATAGRGDGVGQTFDEAMQARNNPRLLEVDRIVGDLRAADLLTKANQETIIKWLENPRVARRGQLGVATDRIEKFLKAELDYLRKSGVELGEVKDGYFPREVDHGKTAANRDKFIRQATKAYEATGLRGDAAKLAAQAYWESIVYGVSGKPGDRVRGGQTPSFVQSRVFSKAAAEHLAEFRVADIDAVLSQYVLRASRRGEIAKRFGDNWNKWQEIEADILKEDPDAQAILPALRDRVAMSAGVQLHSMSHGAVATLSGIRTWTTLATLPKAALSSFGELVIAPMRGTTGNVPGDLAQSLVNLWGHTANFSRTLSGLGRNQQLEAAFEMAEDLGIIAGVGHNNIMAARFAGGDPVGRAQSTVLSEFFKRNLLEQLTNYTRVTSMVSGQVFLRRLGKQMERYPDRAGYFLRELGVPKGQEAQFAKWLRGLGDDLPTPATVTGDHAQTYRTALQRFTDQTVMRPSQSTRPKYASHPLGAMIFQLQSFGYAFQKNVLNRYGRLAATNDLSAMDKLAFSAATLPALAMLVATQGLVRDLRDRLFAPEIHERKTPMAHLEGALSQAGLFGVADPYLQSLTGVRYQRNPIASFVGPAGGGVADITMAAFQSWLNNSPNTNTAERNFVSSTYDWLAEPLMQSALTAAPGGPVSGKLASALTIYAIPKGRDVTTDALAGESNRTQRTDPIKGPIEWVWEKSTGEGGSQAKDSGSRSGGRSSGRSGGRDSAR